MTLENESSTRISLSKDIHQARAFCLPHLPPFWLDLPRRRSDDESVLDLTIVLVDRGKVTIDEYHLNSDDTSYKDGKYYSGLAPGLSVLAVPLYIAVKGAFFFVPEELEERLDSFLGASPGEKFAGDYSLRWTPKPSRQASPHYPG